MHQGLKILIITSFVLQLPFPSISQQANHQIRQKEIEKRWQALKSGLLQRNSLVTTYLTKFDKTVLADSLVKAIKKQIVEHNDCVRRSKRIDSATVQTLSQITDTLEKKYLLLQKTLKNNVAYIRLADVSDFVTKLNKIEDKLFMSKQNYNDMFDANPELCFQLPPRSNIIYPF